ncbi:MAG: PilZ domain-containing protein [Bdellovibrionaceae bacterium]|nr:PilZ domain-containing protein [Pseudobdellovibrionaceae bacterium]
MNNTLYEPNNTAKRYRTQELVHVEICGRHDKIFCKLENLSATGTSLRILSAKAIPRPKDILKITVDLKSLNKIHVVYAEIIWIHGLSLGASFINQESVQSKLSFNKSA